MNIKTILIAFACIAGIGARAQHQQPDDKSLRIVDTLTAQEKKSRNPVLLRSEMDSIIQQYVAAHPQTTPVEQEIKEPEKSILQPYLLPVGIAALLAIALLLYALFSQQRRFGRTINKLNKQILHLEQTVYSPPAPSSTSASSSITRNRLTGPALEKKLQGMTADAEKLEKEKQGLELMLQEYRSIRQDYESVKQQMMEVYKIRNYPGFTKDKSETDILKSLLDTERMIALYAYEHFLKPLLGIADANKNNPAKINPEEREKMLDLLISLALLYSEYLYLRVNELSIGGNMVERIGALRNGHSIDTALLKELSTEHGSRALALRLALDKMGVRHLSYPVFDETNLNLS